MEYLVPWLIAVVAGLMVLVGVFALTRIIPHVFTRTLLRGLAVVLLLLPAPVPSFEGQYAPAFVVALFEAAFQTDGNPFPALRILIAGCIVVIAIVSGFFVWRARRAAGKLNQE